MPLKIKELLTQFLDREWTRRLATKPISRFKGL